MYKLITLILVCVCINTAQANLIRNPSFENVPNNGTGQGNLSSDWIRIQSSPDTYSNDGSFGILPGDFGNFTDLTAHDGLRWTAAWTLTDEQFGQLLTNPLTAGATYAFSAYLLQAVRSDLDFAGGYELYLAPNDITGVAEAVLLGSIGSTSDAHIWEQFSLNFVAPDNAADLPYLIFRPFLDSDLGSASYPGIDSLSLTAVPLPAAVYFFGSALLGLISLRRKNGN